MRAARIRLKLKPFRLAERIFVRCACCHALESRWTDRDNGIGICTRCMMRERVGIHFSQRRGLWNEFQYLLAGLAMIRAIQGEIKLQRIRTTRHMARSHD